MEKLTIRFNTLGKKLSEATDDKHRVEISLEDMRHNLIEAQEERSVLGENLSEAQNQIEELMQLNTTGGSGGLTRRQSLAPSLATFHTADTTNISLDADDSVGALGNSASMEEDMGDVAKQQWEERLESVEMERNRVEVELGVEKEIKERLQKDFTQERDTRLHVEEELKVEIVIRQELEVKLKTETEEKENLQRLLQQENEERSKLEERFEEETKVKRDLEERLAVEILCLLIVY